MPCLSAPPLLVAQDLRDGGIELDRRRPGKAREDLLEGRFRYTWLDETRAADGVRHAVDHNPTWLLVERFAIG